MTADRICLPDSSAPPASLRPGRLDLLDGLRGLAVGAVFLTHLHAYVPMLWKDQQAFDWGPAVMALVPVLWIGVDLFYVLSGFFIGSSILKMRPWRAGEYMKHRALRIVPAYYTALWLVILVSDRGLLESAQGLGNIALHMGFLHIFQAWSLFGIIGPAWTLGVEWSYYLFMLMAAPLWRSQRGGWLLAALLLAGVGWKAGVWFFAQQDQRFFWASQLPGALDEFACGMAVAWLRARGFGASWPSSRRTGAALLALAAGLVCVAGWLAAFYRAPGYWGYWHMVVLSRAWLAAGFALWVMAGIWLSSSRWALGLVKYSGLAALGRISYSVYLYHVPVFLWIGQAMPVWRGPLTLACMTLATLAVSALSYTLVERRFYRGA